MNDLVAIGKRHGLPVPKEDAEQTLVVRWMELHRLTFCHVPNGGQRNKITAARLKGQGVRAGVPDILIFNRPPLHPNAVGTFIEMKRQKGGKTSEEQLKWMMDLRRQGWIGQVCKGYDDAVRFLESVGYGRRG